MPAYELTPNVARLLSLGCPDDVGAEKTAEIIQAIQPEDIPSLIALLEDHPLRWESPDDAPQTWAAIYAWRAVGQLKAEAAVPALIGLLPYIDSHYDEWAQEELPEVFEDIGPACLGSLAEFLKEPPLGDDFWGAVAAVEALQKIAVRYPESRSVSIAALSAALGNYAEAEEDYNGILIDAAAKIRAVEMAPLVQQVFAADRVGESDTDDWEDFQVKVGLLEKRLTPRPGRSLVLPRFQPDSLDAGDEALPISPEWAAPRKQAIADQKKAKNKRKQEKKSRQKNRKKK